MRDPSPPFPGPVLGRGAVTLTGGRLPPSYETCDRVVVDEATLKEPAAAASRLHRAWLQREPVAVVLACDPDELRAPEVVTTEPWQLDPSFELARERLQFLVWNNAWDCRGEEPVWWWARKAARAFPDRVVAGGPADVLVDGIPAWVDGGPRQPLTAEATRGHPVLHRDAVELRRLHLAPHSVPGPAASLAPDQLQAVVHDVGPARIIAPAGSGKTRVLTERLRHLVADRGWEPDGICAVAFNRRAAEEMAERTAGLGLNIRTLNSLGLAIVNGTAGFARPAGRPRRRVIEEPAQRELLEQLLHLRRQVGTDPWVPYLDGLRAIRLGLDDPAAVEQDFDAPGLAEAFPRYQRLLEDKGLVDFDGQLYEALRILLADPVARAAGQSLCRHLLVDEFQDLTPAHLLLLRLLAAPTYDVFGVGDDDQVIYGFGGATPRFLTDFDRYFPGAAHHALEVNYRCPPAVVEAAVHLLSYNQVRVDKRIRPSPGREPVSGELDVRRVEEDVDEAPEARALVQGWTDEGVAHREMAVLARVNSSLLPVQVLLTQAGIPCRRPVDPSILARTGIRTALAYIRIGLEPGRIRRADVAETVRRPSRKIARNVVDMLTRRATTSLVDIRRLADRLDGRDVGRLYEYAEDLDAVVAATRSGDVRRVLRTIRDEVGLGEAMDVLDGSRREADRSTHADDLAALEQVAALHADPATFDAWLREVLSGRSDPGGVEVSTIHRVKGREWDRVVIYGVDEGLVPHRLADDTEEERRLLHVAITRARRQAVVVAHAAGASPFLTELDGSRPRVPVRGPRAAPTGRGASAREQQRLPGGRAAAPPASREELTTDEQRAVFEALKAWRSQVARELSVPAFTVFQDTHLVSMAVARPASLQDLARCKGVGPTKLERWGDEVLAVIDGASG